MTNCNECFYFRDSTKCPKEHIIFSTPDCPDFEAKNKPAEAPTITQPETKPGSPDVSEDDIPVFGPPDVPATLQIKSRPPNEVEKQLLEEISTLKKKLSKLKPKGENFLPATFGDLILSKQPIITDENTELIFLYNQKYGYYDCVNSIPELKKEVQKLIGPSTTKNKAIEVIEYIKRTTYQNILRFDSTQEHICLNNGILNLKTMQLEKHDPTRFISYRIPVEMKQVDQEPWLRYVNSLVKPDDLAKLQEVIGNVFANHYETKKLLYLYGSNDSGKSTFLNILEAFLSPSNCCHLTLKQLGEKFTNASIYGKRANIFADIPYKVKASNYDILKNFTGGDPVNLQFKNKDGFDYNSVAKQFFSGNGIPSISLEEADDPFYRRWEFIKFPNHFDPDENCIKKHATPEMKSAMLNWAIEGYQRLKQNKWILTNQTSIDEAREMFEGIHTEPTGLWLLERCERHMSEKETKKALFEDCKEYHQKKLLPFVDDYDSFCKWMHKQTHIPVISSRPTDEEGEREPSFVGVKLKPKT